MLVERGAGFGFPKARRLRRRSDFVSMQSGGHPGRDGTLAGDDRRAQRRRAGRFVVFLRPGSDGGPGRLGITASARVGGAARRNRIRRLIREAYRTEPTLFPPGYDVVVLATTGEGEWTLQRVVEELAQWKQPKGGPGRSPLAR